ncbi:zinc finger MYM-type protein 1-like [Arctopsyche grandis]|uniref:zinc finger MYM-type protein 1-like n=1 Tax=Arctopsyche grandis TaxID=121162 RepID=UPI00406D9359
MSSFKKKFSGAESRKRKNTQIASSSKLTKIHKFFKASSDIVELSPPAFLSEKQPSSPLSNTDVIEPAVTNNTANLSVAEIQSTEPSSSSSNISGEVVDSFIRFLLQEKYPTDRGHYLNELTENDTNLRKFILNHGTCQPDLVSFPRDLVGKRCFSKKYFKWTNQSGIEIQRTWLGYSVKLNRAYCEPCWLFADKKNKYYNSSWVEGIQDWRGLSKKNSIHEKSQVHTKSCCTYDLWKNSETIDEYISSELKSRVNYWRQVIHRIINVILTLAKCNLAFQGHQENIVSSKNPGNFLSLINLLATYDPLLESLIAKHKAGSVTYLSAKIQNEIIQLISTQIENEIFKEINTSPFYSIIIDGTQDLSKIEQVSVVFRYIVVQKDEIQRPIDVEIKESFVGFFNVKNRSAEGLKKNILDLLTSKGLDIAKCRGQGYDGARVMSGAYNGLQKKITELEPNAHYVHCAAHNLNLVIKYTPLNFVSKLLQSKNVDVISAQSMIKNAYDNLNRFRNTFEEFVTISSTIAKKWGLEPKLTSNRQSFVKKHFDELSNDTRFQDSLKKFEITIFNAALDVALMQLKVRFTYFNDIISKFVFLQSKNLIQLSDDDLYREAKSLADQYVNDFDKSLPNQVLDFRSCLREKIEKIDSVHNLAKLFICDFYTINSSFPDIATAIILFLTLPVTVATAERSFSKLKLIKNYLRSTMSQHRLKGLALISIEHERTNKMNFNEIIEVFANARRTDFST